MQNDEKYLLFVEYNDRIISAVYRLQEKKDRLPGYQPMSFGRWHKIFKK